MIMEDLLDLIVSDVMMLEMDGICFCKVIKEMELIVYLLIIFLIVCIFCVYELEGLGMGVESYIIKFFNV